ncbi:PREDICTED: uncharacterized protein LOC106105127 [Papilio polytes]|uniref:uncharacterized protein LOC106105127 n=1 Tax=Papilio polytes TaxID=76194 RepID=UPI0006764863|nr:PREDICTED: uncharacterized protein LOC106105127 [Papilio polytes]
MNLSEELLLYLCGCILILNNVIVVYLIFYIYRLKKKYKCSILRNPSTCNTIKIDKYLTNDSSNKPTQPNQENIQRKEETVTLKPNNASNENMNIEPNLKEINLDTKPKIVKKPHLPHRTLHRFSTVIEQFKIKSGLGEFSKSSKEDSQSILNNSASSSQRDSNDDTVLIDMNEITINVTNQNEDEVMKLETVTPVDNSNESKIDEKGHHNKNKLTQAILLPNVLEELKEKTADKNPISAVGSSENFNNGSIKSLPELVNENEPTIATEEVKSLDSNEINNKESHIDKTDGHFKLEMNNDDVRKVKEEKNDVSSPEGTAVTVEPVYDLLPLQRRKHFFETDFQYTSFLSRNSVDIRDSKNYVNAKVTKIIDNK